MNATHLSAASDWLHQQQSEMVTELEGLCGLNSWSENVEGLHRTAEHLEQLMHDLGVPCEKRPLAARSWLDDDGQEQSQGTGPWLQWASPVSNASLPRVLLGIHYDTVYPPSHSLQACRRLDDERMNGPGVIDAKGGIIIMRWALLAGLKFRLLDRLQWTMVLNPDEEIGSPCSLLQWKEQADRHDFAMLYEPAMADGSLVDARKGSGNFLWLIGGRSAHAGRNFGMGRNAIVHAASLATELHALNGMGQGVTVNVGRIAGGGPLNVVPDQCALRMNIRVEDEKQLDWVELQLKALLAKFHRPDDGLTCKLEGSLTSPPKIVDAKTRRYMALVERAGGRVGQKIKWKGSGGASDGNKLSAFGLPNIDTFGPEGDELHSQNEWIRLGSLPQKAILSLATLVQIQDEIAG